MKEIKIFLVALICLLLIMPMKSYAADQKIEIQANNDEAQISTKTTITVDERKFNKCL